MITVETSTTLTPIDCNGRDTEIFFTPFTIDSDYFNYSPQKPMVWPEVLMGNHFNQFCIFIRSSAKKLQIANRFKTIDQLLLKQSMTLAELMIGAHVTTNSTACYGYSSSQSSLKLKPHSCLQMHGPCQMQRNGHQMDTKWLNKLIWSDHK